MAEGKLVPHSYVKIVRPAEGGIVKGILVHQGQPVKVKLAAFPFQKYGMAEGTVERVSADAADGKIGRAHV